MPPSKVTKLSLIRHAPAQDEGRLAGRRDVPAHPGAPSQIAALQKVLGAPKGLIASPALRCQQTVEMLWPDATPELLPALWEQDFGAWEGVAYTDLPDLGPLSTADLAAHRPPEGESFNDVCARVAACLSALPTGDLTIVCHAGVIRAALAWALDLGPAALGFAVDPLSLTQIDLHPAGNRVTRTNWIAP